MLPLPTLEMPYPRLRNVSLLLTLHLTDANMGHQCPLFANHIMPLSVAEKMRDAIRTSTDEVFLRSTFAQLGAPRQVSRALRVLQAENLIQRLGYGVYAKPEVSGEVDTTIKVLKAKLGKRVARTLTIGTQTVRLGPQNTHVRNAQSDLDVVKLRLAEEIVSLFPIEKIRERGLANLARWESNGVWVSAYDEWRELLTKGSDDEVRSIMLGHDDDANRLRQSPPYTGLLPQDIVRKIYETQRA